MYELAESTLKLLAKQYYKYSFCVVICSLGNWRPTSSLRQQCVAGAPCNLSDQKTENLYQK